MGLYPLLSRVDEYIIQYEGMRQVEINRVIPDAERIEFLNGCLYSLKALKKEFDPCEKGD